MNNLEIALAYLKRGVSVMPLWSPEMIRNNPERFKGKLEKKFQENSEKEIPLSNDEVYKKLFIDLCKSPVLYTWKEYQARLPTVEEVTQWFTENPFANIAIITGKISNLVVFDLDSQKAMEYATERGGFPKTPRSKTGKGSHIFMKYPGIGHIGNQVKKELTIDIRADGGYVVAPPSIHGSGGQYQWEEGASIFDLEPTECTGWMLEYLRGISNQSSENKKDKEPKAASRNERNESEKRQPQDMWVEVIRSGCSEGERNQTATRLIGHFLKKGIDESEAWELIITWNLKNKPPIDLNELRKTFESVKVMESKNDHRSIIEIDSLLDNPQLLIKEYEENYVRIPFAGTNLAILEKRMNGGLIGGRLYVLGGIPSSGKTVLANNMADNICLNGTPVLFFSYDDGRTELRYRTLARLGELRIQTFNLKSQPKIRGVLQCPSYKEGHGFEIYY